MDCHCLRNHFNVIFLFSSSFSHSDILMTYF
ncbi:hypothetical protein LEMLEM_LOCUS20161 [Lemmus lemmus]